ncbi:MAG TPA: tetratricopeptide repeat protein [Terriglobales bacterium]|nr:tetratricopeptide repeat protein [Terriglobales bacterium]
MSVAEPEFSEPQGWKSVQVYTMAGICLVIGVALGYLFRGSASKPEPKSPVVQASGDPASAAPQMPSLDQMKQMADKQAEPLLAKLKTDPNNSDLLSRVATVYEKTHQFGVAADYYQKAVQADPKNLSARTELASCLYYEGDVEGAVKQLQASLAQNPQDANSLFNLGMIRWKGKGDAKGAIEAWKQLLKSNPQMSSDKKAQVQRMLAEVQQQASQR